MRFRSSWICRTICILVFLVGLSWAGRFGSNNNNKAKNPRSNNRRRGGGGGGGGGDGGDDDDYNNYNNNNVISHVKVSCRGQWYEIHDVTTVADLLQQVQQQASSSLTFRDLQTAKLLHRGKVLENRQDKLKENGIRDGSMIFVVPENYRFKPHEALAIFLEMMAKEDNNGAASPLAKLFGHFQEEDMDVFFQNWDEFFRILDDQLLNVRRDEIKQFMRNEVDLGYHRLRMLWEQPTFRQALLNPGPIETYRQVLANHLPQSIQNDFPPSMKQVLQNPQIWRKFVLQVTGAFFRIGDLLFDVLLDIVLDVVRGAGTSTTSSLSSQFVTSSPASSSSSSSSQQTHHYEPTMDDPTIANHMLFELSESEED